MWRNCCKARACCLAALALLGGCRSTEKVEPDTSKDYAIINFSQIHWQITNAEGQEVHWRKNLPENAEKINSAFFEGIEGDMELWDEYSLGWSYDKTFTTSFSDSFTVQTRLPMREHVASFSAEFYKDGQCVQDLYVGGDYEGTATLCADGTVELHGNFKDFSCIYTFEKDGKQIELEGSGKRRIKIYLEDGDIVAEGMTGEYTITEYGGEYYQEKLSTETRQGDS